jgi:hypothetical protein
MSAPVPNNPASGQSELRRRRDRLAEEVAELQWALGGLAYEMAIRDHFRLDVLLRRAGILQERDAELAEVERLLHMQESSVAGNCPACGAVRSRGAVYCWQCGTAMMERSPLVSDAVTTELGTAVSREDRVPLPPVPAPNVLSPEALAPDRQDTLVDPPPDSGSRPGTRSEAERREPQAGAVKSADGGRQDALGAPVSIRP